MTVPAGAKTAAFVIQTRRVTIETTGAIRATLGTVTKSVTLTVVP